jgi:hypothetical protein
LTRTHKRSRMGRPLLRQGTQDETMSVERAVAGHQVRR